MLSKQSKQQSYASSPPKMFLKEMVTKGKRVLLGQVKNSIELEQVSFLPGARPGDSPILAHVTVL